MRKGLKRVLCLGLTSVMAVGLLSGCGKKAGSGDEFIIGGIGPLSGAAASYGVSVKQGAEVAVNEINKAGGVKVGDKSLTLKLVFEDDEASPDVTTSAYNTVMDKGAQAILGTVTSGAGLAINEQTNNDGIFQVNPSGSAKDLTKFKNQFRLCFTDPYQGQTMADYAVDKLGYKKIAVIYNNADEYSKGLMDAFVAEVEAKGGQIVDKEAFKTDDNDFTTQLTKIKGTDAQAIFVPAYYQDAAYITTQAAELKMTIPFLGSDGWDGVVAKTVDKTVLEGAIFLSPFNAQGTEENTQKFVKAYQDAYKATPDQFAADGYDSVYVMKAALEKAQSTKSADLIKAMYGVKYDGLTGSMTFTQDNECSKAAKFIEIKDGTYVTRTE